MGTLIDRVERLLFGATAHERGDMMIELAARRAEERIVAALEAGGPEYDAVYDLTFTDAMAHGLDNDAAHAEAARVAEKWLAAQRVARQANAPGKE